MQEDKNIETNIVETTARTIANYNLDVALDLTEIGIDSLLDESFLKELPLAKTIYGFTKTGLAIREKHLLKKTLVFIKQL